MTRGTNHELDGGHEPGRNRHVITLYTNGKGQTEIARLMADRECVPPETDADPWTRQKVQSIIDRWKADGSPTPTQGWAQEPCEKVGGSFDG
jgi:hypothetical protein